MWLTTVTTSFLALVSIFMRCLFLNDVISVLQDFDLILGLGSSIIFIKMYYVSLYASILRLYTYFIRFFSDLAEILL